MRRTPLEIFVWSRAATWLLAVAALLALVPERDSDAVARADPNVIDELGYATDVWARWDSYWFLRIAENGYDDTASTAFYPLYPALVGVLGRVFADHYVVAGIVVSLAACAAAFGLLYRLALERFPEDVAARSVAFLAVFPTAFFLQAVYSEALFLALALGAFLYAERGRFGPAAALTALAILTRPTGLALVPALLFLAWRSPARGRALVYVAATPGVLGLYALLLWQQFGKPLAFLHTEGQWYREMSALGPLGGLWDGARAAWAGALQLTVGSAENWYWVEEGADQVALTNLENFGALVLLAGLGYVAWTRIGPAYGLYCAASAVLALSVPTQTYPLLSLPRFAVVVFPVFIALALVACSRRAEWAVVGFSSLLLALHVVQWTLWRWVA